MPCYAERTVEQTLDNIPDLKLLAGGLQEMGFRVYLSSNTTISFSGVDKTTGMYQSGSYANGKLTTQEGLDLEVLKKYVAVANVKAQVAANNNDKYKKTKLTLHKTGEFSYKVTKQ
jgi:hypothetical protein